MTEYLTVDSMKQIAENAYGYLNTQEGHYAIVGVMVLVARWLVAEFGLPAVKVVLTSVFSVFRREKSPLLEEVLKSLDDPQAMLNESASGTMFDELMACNFVVKYDKDKAVNERLKGILTRNRDVLDVLTAREKKAVSKKLTAAVSRVKARDWANQRQETLRLLVCDDAKADMNRRA